MENSKETTEEKLLKLLNEFLKEVGYKINLQKWLHFYKLVNEQSKYEIKETNHFIITSKNMILSNKFNQRIPWLVHWKLQNIVERE